MFCTNCGKVIDDDAVHCVHCGAKVGEEPVAEQPQQPVYVVSQQPQTVYVVPQQVQEKKDPTNIWAIIALVSTFVGPLIIPGIGMFAGLVFGIIGLVQSKKMEGKGKGMSIASIILSILIIVFLSLGTILSFVLGLFTPMLSIIPVMIEFILSMMGVLEEIEQTGFVLTTIL